MITFRLKELLLQKGMKPIAHTLTKLGLPLTASQQYLSGNAKSIKLEHLELLCLRLNCTPKEILSVINTPKEPIDPKHPLADWIIAEEAIPFEVIKNFSPEKLAQVNEFLKGMMEEGI